MDNKILGLHHITAIASDAKRNVDFYTHILGLRMVKKTVNFDDSGTYHFYYGNETGAPGTILTFFPWEGIGQGTNGAGQATHIGYAIAPEAYDFWKQRLTEKNISFEEAEIFGERLLSFKDPDGLQLQFIVPKNKDQRIPWTTADIDVNNGLKGFHNTTLTLHQADATIKVLTDVLGYNVSMQEGNRYRLSTDAIDTAHLMDIIEDASIPYGRGAAGTNHHIAFRVQNDDILMHFREKVLSAGYQITPKIDRDYFFSLYFREPGGVLFEIATDNPGFTRDEPLAELGQHLKLPKQYEAMRSELEKVLPKV